MKFKNHEAPRCLEQCLVCQKPHVRDGSSGGDYSPLLVENASLGEEEIGTRF